jgi:hypothetical protein
MAPPIATYLRAFLDWLNGLPKRPFGLLLVLLCGIVASLATFSSSLNIIFITASDIAYQLRYPRVAHHYVTPDGEEFLRLPHGYWIDRFKRKPVRFLLQEFYTDRTYIYLYDSSRPLSNDPTDPLLWRIPVEGGRLADSYANPIDWVDRSKICRETCRSSATSAHYYSLRKPEAGVP